MYICVYYVSKVLFVKPTLASAQMLVVSDIEDMFLPLQDGFLADPNESK